MKTKIIILCTALISLITSCSKKTEVKGKVVLKSGLAAPNVNIYLIKTPNNCLKCAESWIITNTDNNGEYHFIYNDDRQHFYDVSCKTDSSNQDGSIINSTIIPGKTNEFNFKLTK